METATVPLSELKFGNDPAAPAQLNARTTGKLEGIEGLAATVQHYIDRNPGHSGLILPLIVVRHNGMLFVADGDRRLAALKLLGEKKAVTSDHPVPVMEQPLEEALSMSLGTAIHALPHHPIDQFEAFAELSKTMSENDLANAYAIKPQQVKRVMALGSLSPKIRKLWRDGKVDEESAKAFTLLEDHKRQDQLYARLTKNGSYLYAHIIRREILGDSDTIKAHLKFVGTKAYENAGGAIVKDLFTDHKGVSDAELLSRLAREKLEKHRDKLRTQGWAWVELKDDLDEESGHWRTLEREHAPTPTQAKKLAELEKKIESFEGDQSEYWGLKNKLSQLKRSLKFKPWTKAQKSQSGVVLQVNWEGKLCLEEGLVKPSDDTSQDKDEPKAKKKTSTPAISNALHQRLSQQLTKAVGQAIASDPKIAVAIVAAALATTKTSRERYDWGNFCSPICLFEHGMKRRLADRNKKRTDFHKLLPEMINGGLDHQISVLTQIAGEAVDIERHKADQNPQASKDVKMLITMLDVEAFRKATKELFDPEDYFKSVSKTLVEKAIVECGFAIDQYKTALKTKGKAVDFAMEHVVKTGWLPPQLRTIHYDGPGAKQAKKPAKKAPARKKAA